MSLRELNRIALIAALITALARISIPLPFSPVPVTGQLIGVLLAGLLLGGKHGFIAVLSYLMLGAAGAPVFSYGLGGPMILLGPSGGYLWGFLPGVFILGKLLERESAPGCMRTSLAMLCCLACTYLAGALQLAMIMRYSTMETLLAGVIPFIPADLGKLAFAATAGARIKRSITSLGLLPPSPSCKQAAQPSSPLICPVVGPGHACVSSNPRSFASLNMTKEARRPVLRAKPEGTDSEAVVLKERSD